MPRIMIVEDDLTILDNLSQLLRLNGLNVIEAYDGEMAWVLLNEAKHQGLDAPAMIVSDLMMPNMDGFDLLRAVRADASLKSLPFVLLSARSDASDLQTAFAMGANDYLIKPFEVEQLLDVIRYQLGKADTQANNLNDTVNPDFFLE